MHTDENQAKLSFNKTKNLKQHSSSNIFEISHAFSKKKKKLSLWAVMILIISLAVGSIRYLEKQSQAKSGLLIVAWLADVKRPWGSRGCCHHAPRPSHSTLMMPPQIVQAVGISSPSYFIFFNLSNPGESSRLYSTVLFQANILLHCAPEHN